MSKASKPPARHPAAAMRYFLALRPWSLPITVASGLVSLAASRLIQLDASHSNDLIPSPLPMLSAPVFLAFLALLLVHSFSNLINSFFDYLLGVDQKSTSEDRTMVDAIISIKEAKFILYSMFIAIIAVVTALYYLLPPLNSHLLLIYSGFGIFLAYSYTGSPFNFKYYSLGDFIIFLCFGPLLQAGMNVIVNGSSLFPLPAAVSSLFGVSSPVLPLIPSSVADLHPLFFSFPLAFSITAILHANNTRDRFTDAQKGAKTVAQFLGFTGSLVYFCLLYIGNLAIIFFLALRERSAFILMPFLTIPMGIDVVTRFYQQRWEGICQKCAEYATLNGLALAAGMTLTIFLDKQ